MREKFEANKMQSEQVVNHIRRAMRKQHSAEEKIRIVLDGRRGEYSIAELCRHKGIAESLYNSWSKEFLETGKRRLAGDTARAATSDDVKHCRSAVRRQVHLGGRLKATKMQENTGIVQQSCGRG